MKKIVLLVLLLSVVILPAMAKTSLLNLGYNVQGDFWGADGLKLRSVSLNYTRMGGDTSGFYSQINPYVGLSFKNSAGSVFKLSDYNELLVGGNFILGYGGDINFGPFGLLIGGGLFIDLQYYDYGGYTFSLLSGLGVGANFYFQPGTGTFVLNAGMNFAWHPWAYEIYDGGSGSYSNYGMGSANFNIGVGWRTGGIGTKSEADW